MQRRIRTHMLSPSCKETYIYKTFYCYTYFIRVCLILQRRYCRPNALNLPFFRNGVTSGLSVSTSGDTEVTTCIFVIHICITWLLENIASDIIDLVTLYTVLRCPLYLYLTCMWDSMYVYM